LQELLEVALFSPDVRTLASPKSKEKLSMKRLFITAVLAVALSSVTFAGQIPTDGSPAPAPTPSAQAPTTTSPGDIPTDGLAGQISDEALSALLSVIALVV
jgi:hypothetical protein